MVDRGFTIRFRYWAWGFGLFLAFSSLYVDPDTFKLQDALSGPTADHILGTDMMGRDLMARIVAAFTFFILPLWALVVLWTIVGMLFGYGYSAIGDLKLSIAKWLPISFGSLAMLLAAVPVYVLALVWSIWAEAIGFWSVAGPLSLIVVVNVAILLRSLYLEDCQKEYWLAHKSFGGSLAYRFWVYGVRQNWQRKIRDSLIFNCQMALIVETSLSYLGFGIPEPSPSLGNILASHMNLAIRGDFRVIFIVIAAMGIFFLLPHVLVPGSLFLPKPSDETLV